LGLTKSIIAQKYAARDAKRRFSDRYSRLMTARGEESADAESN